MKWLLIILGIFITGLFVIALIGMMLPKAHRASHMARFTQPPEAIFAAITGPQEWRGVTKTELPSNGGPRRWRENWGRRSITFEEAANRPPNLYSSRIADPRLPFSGTWTWEITATDDGCICRITEEGQVRNPVFRFVSRFILGQTRTIDTYLRALGAKFNEPVQITE